MRRLAGWIAGMIMKTKEGLVLDIVIGVVGALIGGLAKLRAMDSIVQQPAKRSGELCDVFRIDEQSGRAEDFWNTAAIGASVAVGRYEIGLMLSLLNVFTMRALVPACPPGAKRSTTSVLRPSEEA